MRLGSYWGSTFILQAPRRTSAAYAYNFISRRVMATYLDIAGKEDIPQASPSQTRDSVSITINGKEYLVPAGINIVEACRLSGIKVPALCYHPRLPVAGQCRVCTVEVANDPVPMKLGCSTLVADHMIISTNSQSVRSIQNAAFSARMNLAPKAALSKLPEQFAGSQEIEDLAKYSEDLLIDDSSPSIYRDMSKCIGCTRCIRACSNKQGMDIYHEKENPDSPFEPRIDTQYSLPLDMTDCIACGQCAVACPTGAITEKDDTKKVFQAMEEGKVVVIQTAPSIRVAVSELFGLPPGTLPKGKLVAACKALGFSYVFDTTFTADLTIMEEGSELLGRIDQLLNGSSSEKSPKLPMYTSCCPGWINLVEKLYPELIPHLSSCKSPQNMLGSLIKSYWANLAHVDPQNIFSVSLMPCTAKKGEILRPDMYDEHGRQIIDAVITTREFGKMLRQKRLTNWNKLPELEFDNPIGESSGAGALFGVTGGVMEAALRTAYELKTGKTLPQLKFDSVRGLEGVKISEVDFDGLPVRTAVVHGMAKGRQLLKSISSGEVPNLHFVEVMACEGGCIGGGGQPLSLDPDILTKRMLAIYSQDERSVIRKSHENPYIQRLYKDFLGAPLGEMSHKLLHTHYIDLSQQYGKNAPCMKGKVIAEKPAMISDLKANTVLVMYGSQSGTAKKAAEILAGDISSTVKGVSVNCLPLESFPGIESISAVTPKAMLCISSTFGDGDFPDNAKSFWNVISASKAEVEAWRKVPVGVFGLGSSAYGKGKFCKAGKMLTERLTELGANFICESGFGDEKASGGYHAAFDPWSKQVLGALGSKGYALHDPPIPAYRISLALESKRSEELSIAPPRHFHFCHLPQEEVLTIPGYEREVRKFQIDLSGSTFSYEVGDHLGIMPKNDPTRTGKILSFLGIDPNVHVSISHNNPKDPSELPMQSTLSVFEIFSQYLDLQGRPTKKFYESLFAFCSDPIERRQLQRLFSEDPIDEEEYISFSAENDYIDSMLRFPSAIPPVENLLSMIPFIQPRWYSIASSPSLKNNIAEICVVIDQWKSPQGKVRKGLTTSYLFNLDSEKNPKIPVQVREGILKMPKVKSAPILMVGLGTGLAPMFGILQERKHIIATEGLEALGPAVLYLGVRHQAKDYIQREFLEECLETGALTELIPAFSHDQKQMIFVQDKMREIPEPVHRVITDPNSEYFYCGPAMAGGESVPGVIESGIKFSLVKCTNAQLDKEGSIFKESDASSLIEDMKAQDRWHVEAF